MTPPPRSWPECARFWTLFSAARSRRPERPPGCSPIRGAPADAAAQAAAVHAHQDRRGSDLAARTRAHRLAQACEGARTPALAAIAAPLPLTHREREIATLAAGGLPNRQIAQRLILSVRTVENHLCRAYAKLGAANRAELAALLRSH